jgi:hypothetical protein
VNGLSDSIAWPSRDPQWVSKVLLTGLILLIPIVGQMVVLGWMLATVDNMRAGRQELPPAGFSYIGRGLPLFVVYLVYGLAIAVVFAGLLAAGVLISVAGRDAGTGPLGAFFILLSYGLVLLASLGLYVLSPPIIVATERGGIGGGLNLPWVIRMVSADVNSALYAGLFSLVAYLIGSIGAIACGIGQILTLPYGYAVLAGVVHHDERTAGPQATSVA